jgi:flagellum-specific ATP synthase
MVDGFPLARYLDLVRRTDPMPQCGRVVRTVGLVIESEGPRARVGELCLLTRDGEPPLPVEVVGFRDGHLLSVPLGGTAGAASLQRRLGMPSSAG